MSYYTQLSIPWIFVSHSSLDLEKVREIRNYLEEKGAGPLLFHLKCIEKDENLFQLLEKEIEARAFFLLCDSENAQNSSFVQREWQIASSQMRKRLLKIDISQELELNKKKIDDFLSLTNIFASFAWRDNEKVNPILEKLALKDFGIFFDESLKSGEVFYEEFRNKLESSSKNGIILIFLSRNSISSQFAKYEIGLALELAKKILFVSLEDISSFGLWLDKGIEKHNIVYIDALNVEKSVDIISKSLLNL